MITYICHHCRKDLFSETAWMILFGENGFPYISVFDQEDSINARCLECALSFMFNQDAWRGYQTCPDCGEIWWRGNGNSKCTFCKLPIAGVYEIKNKVNNHRYIGSSKDLDRRLRDHKYSLNAGTHRNIHLQRAWNKYGEDAFVFDVIITCDDRSTIYLEQECIDEMEPEYNIAKTATGGAGSCSEETKRKLRKANLGKTLTKEHIEKIRAAQIGIPRGPLSEEHKQKLSEIHMGHVVTEATRKKISKSHMGISHPQSEATRKKISESLKKTLATSHQG